MLAGSAQQSGNHYFGTVCSIGIVSTVASMINEATTLPTVTLNRTEF